jgi:hypothetical protein
LTGGRGGAGDGTGGLAAQRLLHCGCPVGMLAHAGDADGDLFEFLSRQLHYDGNTNHRVP